MYLVRDTLHGHYRIAKKISLEQNSRQDEGRLLNEVTLLQELSHPHILMYHDILLEDDQLTVLLEFCEGTFPLTQTATWPACSTRRSKDERDWERSCC